MRKNIRKPNIRFTNYNNDWEQRKLGDVVERVTRKNQSLLSKLPLTISAQDGLIDQNEYFNKTIASKDVSGYYLIKNGEFAYNKSYSNGYPWGAIKRLDYYEMGVLSTLYIIFKPVKINSEFLAKYYDTTYWHKEVSKHAAEGARNHGLLNIAASDFFQTELMIPTNEEEQQQIGVFFSNLDNLITLHQRKLNYLESAKTTFLNMMFPKKDANIPEFRFVTFNNKFRKQKASLLFEESNLKNTKLENFPILTSSKNGIYLQKDYFDREIASVNTDNYKIVPKNYFTYRSMSDTESFTFNIQTIVDNGLISPAYPVFRSKNKDSKYYLYFYLNNSSYIKKQLLSLREGGTRLSLGYSKFIRLNIQLPELTEQKQIGLFFKSIDNLITLHQRKLEGLEDIKKYYLKHMFV